MIIEKTSNDYTSLVMFEIFKMVDHASKPEYKLLISGPNRLVLYIQQNNINWLLGPFSYSLHQSSASYSRTVCVVTCKYILSKVAQKAISLSQCIFLA